MPESSELTPALPRLRNCFLAQESESLFALEAEDGFLLLDACQAADGLSSLVQGYLTWSGKRRDVATVAAVLDLYAGDQWVLSRYGPLYVQVGGSFAGVQVPYEVQAVVDGSTLRVCLGRVSATSAHAAGKAWYEAMVMRVRAALASARNLTDPVPGNPFEVL